MVYQLFLLCLIVHLHAVASNEYFPCEIYTMSVLQPALSCQSVLKDGKMPNLPKNLTSKIRKIELRYNNLTKLTDGMFKDYISLEEMFFTYNSMESISESAFVGLDKLNILDLSHNALSSIGTDAFKPLRNLKEIKMIDNKLSELKENMFAGLFRLKKMDLTGNK